MKLAILGGEPIRTKPFMSRPKIDEGEKNAVLECLEEKMFSRFVGSPVGDFRRYLRMTSEEAAKLQDFWSVLGGPYTRRFEAKFSELHETIFSISSNSATSSLISAVIAAGIKPGDEVITTPFSFTATATAIKLAGAKVVFADIDESTFNLTAETVKKRITSKTKAVIPVHLLGNDADIFNIKQLCQDANLILLEDSAQAILTKTKSGYLGTFGLAGAFSFQESKNMMTGEGGMCITNDEKMAYRLRLIRNHGEAMVFEGQDDETIIERALGYNFRLPDPLSAIGLFQAHKLADLQKIRNENYVYLKGKLEKFSFITLQKVSDYIEQFNPYCVGLNIHLSGIHRNTVAYILRSEGIPVTTGFPRLLNENPLTKESVENTPIAYRVNYDSYLGFFQVGYPNTTKDMDDIVNAFQKIEMNLNEIRKLDSEYNVKREYTLGR